MDKVIMKQATFSELCRILKNRNDEIKDCVVNIFRLGLLFLPGMVCKESEIFDFLSSGLTILDSFDAIHHAKESIKRAIVWEDDFVTCYENLLIVQVLIVFSAYFDSIKTYLPDASKKITLTDSEKLTITDDSLKAYQDKIRHEASCEFVGKEFQYNLDLPNCIDGMRRSQKRILEFYNMLNIRFQSFLFGFKYVEDLQPEHRARLHAILRELPNLAVMNYKAQYNALCSRFPEFFTLANKQEHEEILTTLNVGFKNIPNQFRAFQEEKVHDTLRVLPNHYSRAVRKRIFGDGEPAQPPANDIVCPKKEEVFIPQSFKALRFKKGMKLEPTETWKDLKERQDIGSFIEETLLHPELGAVPMLLLGHPGSGKTLLCNMLGAKRLCDRFHTIIIRLRSVSANTSIERQINEQLDHEQQNNCKWNDIIYSKPKKPILLIFDGYDELLQASGKNFENYIDQVREFQEVQLEDYGVFVRCIITSRTTLIDKSYIPEDSPIISLCDFDDQRISAWSNIWNMHNKAYFREHCLTPFFVDKNSKIYKLAQQPLLLSMLALYDTDNNALKQEHNLSGTELYENLIRSFVRRELQKNQEFDCCETERDRDAIIDAEVLRLSISAMGMFNRQQLYIRSDQLNADLECLKGGKPLKGDLEFRKFFFIHSMHYKLSKDHSQYAYEFLHATFSEFLTARFITEQLMMLEDGIPENTWYIALAFTPLFSRFEIVRMIREWAAIKLSRNIVKDNLERLIDNELSGILSGELMVTLHQIATTISHLPRGECINHVSIYTANLLILRLMLDDYYVVQYERFGGIDIWSRILQLWRYSFSDKDYISIISLFYAERQESSCRLVYQNQSSLFDNYYKATEDNRLSHLFTPANYLEDELIFGLSGALIGTSNRKLPTTLRKLNLKVEAQNELHDLLSNLCNGIISDEAIEDSLTRLHNACLCEPHESFLLAYYLILHHLFKVRKIKTLPHTEAKKLAISIVGDIKWLHQHTLCPEARIEQLVYLSDLCIDLMVYIDFADIKTAEEFYKVFLLEELLSNTDYIYYWTRFYKQLSHTQNAVFITQNRYNFKEELKQVASNMKLLFKNSPNLLLEAEKYSINFLEFILTLFKQNSVHAGSLFISYIEALYEVLDFNHQVKMKQACLIASCMYWLRSSCVLSDWLASDQTANTKVQSVLYYVMRYLSVTDMYWFSPQAAYHLVWMVDLIPAYHNQIVSELVFIIEKYKKSISIEFIQKLQYLSTYLQPELAMALKAALVSLRI